MENITNFTNTADEEYEREEALADERSGDVPDVPEGIFGELPPDPAVTGRVPAAAETERGGEAMLPPE